MSATDVATVTLEIDGRELTVPKGTPLVLAAATAGVEIPIFCYEPRLGPADRRVPHVPGRGRGHAEAAGRLHHDRRRRHEGAHALAEAPRRARRRCSSSSSSTIRSTAPSATRAASVPLQDLTYRYGPGNTRFHLNKRTYEKPLPISPLIALDRRALHPLLPLHALLAGRRRGRAAGRARARRDLGHRDVRGAALPRSFLGQRDRAVPGRCADVDRRTASRRGPGRSRTSPACAALCPTGCNTWAHACARARVRRMLSRNHPGVDEGWLCDKGRFAHVHLRAADRYLAGSRARPARARACERGADRRDDRAAPAPSRHAARPGLHRGGRIGRADQRGGPRLGRARARRRRRRARQQRVRRRGRLGALAPYAARDRRPRPRPT